MNGETKKILKKLACVCISILFMTVSAKATLVNSNSIVQDGIEYYIQTDKAVYDLGESVEMLYRVTNLRDEEVSFAFPNTPEWNFWVERDGQSIWRAVNGWYTMGCGFTLNPGESKQFPTYNPPYIWDMRDSENNLVDVGEYSVIGGLDGGTGEYDSTGVPVLIEIVPEPATILLFGLSMLLVKARRFCPFTLSCRRWK